MKLTLTKIIGILGISAGLISGIFVTRFFYADDIALLSRLKMEKEYYIQIKEDQAGYIDTLSDLFKETVDSFEKQKQVNLGNVQDAIKDSKLGNCPVDDGLLDALDAVGKERVQPND